MNSGYSKEKKSERNRVKYNIFNLMLLCFFFAFVMMGGVVKAAESIVVHQSNHKGNNGDSSILGVTGLGKNAYYNNNNVAFIQTTGEAVKNTVSFTLTIEMPKSVTNRYTISGSSVNKEGGFSVASYDQETGKFTIGSVEYTKKSDGIYVGETKIATLTGAEFDEFELSVANKVNGVVVFESGYTVSGGQGAGAVTVANYDSYKKDVYGEWTNMTGGVGTESGQDAFAKGLVLANNTNFATTAASSTQLEANSSGAGNYSLFYISEVIDGDNLVVTLNYVYTIRSPGWGTKTINITLYNDSAYDSEGNLLDPTAAHYRTVDFITSRPIDKYNDGNGETIIASAGAQCGKFTGPNRVIERSPEVVSSDQYDDICITYINSNDKSNDKNGKPMTISLPKEVAYNHKITTGLAEGANPTLDQIKAQSIYAINTFSNAGATGGKVVKYYYWNFKDASNTSMLPSEGYTMTLMVDASGVYVLEIRDVFGNEFVSSGVEVSDIEITNIIVDHTGAAVVNIMKATGEYADTDGWKQAWSFGIDEPYEIVFSKIQKGEVTVTLHVFQKKVIKLGVFEGVSSGVEDIAKQPHSHTDVGATTLSYPSRFSTNDVVIWRVANPTVDAGYETALSSAIADANDKVSCGTTNEIAYDCTFSVGDYGDSKSYNKITFKVKNNGRYRVMITDSYGNTTDTTEYNDEGNGIDYTNPEVEVSVVDRTTPVITSSLSGATTSAASTSVNSHVYVIGGGNDQRMNPTISGEYKDDVDELPDDYYTTGIYDAIYYNYNGLKAFTYEDALKIAKIQVVDDVYYYTSSSKNNDFSGYEVSFSGTSGVYADPASGYKSARTGAGTTNYDLHSYMITNNVTSFSYGLVKEVGYTNVANEDIDSYSKINGSTAALEYVNGSGSNFYSTETFLGYLGIEFQIKVADGSYKSVCELSIDDNDESSISNSSNVSCFEKMNKIIDDVENFRMIFSATDAVGNSANKTYTVEVRVIDTTNPGINPEKKPIKYTNTYSLSQCRLEIGVNIQNEKTLLECYGIMTSTPSDNYFVIDNNVYSGDDYNSGTGEAYVYDVNDKGDQYYLSGTGGYDYLTKIKTSVKEGNDFTEIGADNTKVLNKSGDHFIKIEISDHWKNSLNSTDTSVTSDNTLVFIINYYVNPKTLLIEPLANEKMYGEKDPIFDYCVYINADNSTFYYDNYFLDKEFINRYFNHIYCTKDVYVEMKPTNVYAAPSNQTADAGYSYYQFAGSYDSSVTAVNTAAIDGKYLKVNNTFVYINGGNTGLNAGNRYNVSYESKSDGSGEYIGYTATGGGGTVYEKILNGYKYMDETCTTAYMDSALTGYFYRTTSNKCTEVTSSNTYDRKYTQSSTGTFLKYNNSNASTSVLVSGDSFTGKLARVESSCYNSDIYGTIEKDSVADTVEGVLDNFYDATSTSRYSKLINCAEETHTNNYYKGNDNVGQYNIVLGTLAISRTGDAANYNKDYVIKINTNYWSAGTVTDTTGTGTKTQSTTTTTDYGTAKVRDILVDNKLVDDVIKEESTVKFTIRQAVLTVTARGDSKLFGEQDSYSNNWNNTTTAKNNSDQGYLGGYTIYGYRYDDADADNVVLGALRRKIGEQVGIYKICNLAGNPSDTDELSSGCDNDPKVVNQYDATTFWNFAGYAGLYASGGATGGAVGTADTAALTIDINSNINAKLYGSATGRKLNGANRNYAIIYIGNDYYIQPGQITVQPGVNQGKEYSDNAYSDPLWQLVVYGETITQQNDGSWNTNIAPSTTSGQFSGYTESYAVETYETYARAQVDTQYEHDTEIYFARRKTSPDLDYTYVVPVTVTKKYAQTDGIYHKSTSGTYIYAYGQYHRVDDAAIDSTVYITVVGRLVNQTYTMFNDGDSVFVLERENGSDVEWYKYVEISNIKYNTDNTTIKYYTLKQNSNTKCVITSNAVTAKVSADEGEALVNCTNYNVNYTNIAPVSYPSIDGNTPAEDIEDIVNLRTTYTTSDRPEYKPDGIHSCISGGDAADKAYSYPCDDDSKYQITFEIFKREIHLEFIDYNYTFVYGNRYNWYYTNIMEITDGNQGSKEGDVFVCYSDLGDYVVDCTNDPDYGLTAGDEWDDIGLEFHMHSTVSATASAYYDNDDYAVPAGMYYVYASITEIQNYKFVYRGGTLTISPKVTHVELTGYTKEYGENYYASYGTGTDYTNYMLQGDTKRVDSNFTTSNDTLITVEGIGTANEHGNSYGFVIEGLDDKDTIAQNFKGRPNRVTGENVGIYAISVNTIANIKNTLVKDDTSTTSVVEFKECATVDEEKTCTFVTRTAADKTDGRDNAQNYHIKYSLDNNEGAYLYITPARITIEVLANQTKMYGCAYYRVVTSNLTDGETNVQSYYDGYTYESGYDSENCKTTANTNLDFAYKYTVTGDKDAKVDGYTVTTSTDGTWSTNLTGGKSSSLDNTTRLFRILKDVANYDYSYDTEILAKLYVTAGTKGSGYEYQGQGVGVYAITLGDLDVKLNEDTNLDDPTKLNTNKCDAYNNPAANGTYKCKNYNINYYGNSTSKDNDVDAHKYTETTKVAKSDLALYTLNYTADANGDYVLINGKFIDKNRLKISGTTVTVNDYVKIEDIDYNKQPQYSIDASGEYIKLDGFYVTVASLSGSRYPSSTGGTPSGTGDYLKVGNKYIKLSTITKYRQNYVDGAAESTHYLSVTSGTGTYVLINGSYVELDDLVRYKLDGSNYVEDSSGAYVMSYKTVDVSSLTRYSLDITNVTNKTFNSGATEGKNVYAFVNGSYVPLSSLTFDGENKVTVNSANVKDDEVVVLTRGDVTTDIDFTIIARKVFVHPEFNIKAYSEDEPVEYITCAEIANAYPGRNCSHYESYAENYETDGAAGARLELGVSMYYAVENSLAKAPWTAWQDRRGSEGTSQRGYNDIQFDVLRGLLKRDFVNSEDIALDTAGKYSFDFSDVTNVGTVNGRNYMIVHVTEMDNGASNGKGTHDGNGMDNTYLKGGTKLSTVMYEECVLGEDYCATDSSGSPIRIKTNKNADQVIISLDFTLKVDNNGDYSAGGSISKSISLVSKYDSSNNRLLYWHLGFYKEDTGSDRAGELAKWWSNRNPFKTPYDTFKTTDNSDEGEDGSKVHDPYFELDRPVYFEIVKRTIFLYAVDVEKVYGEQDKYRDFLVAICPNDQGYTIDGSGNVKCKSETVEGSTFTSAYGLGKADYDRFLGNNNGDYTDDDGIMRQDTIRGITNSDNYVLSGKPHKENAFGIYFRRTPGEDAGVYSVTACAAQSDVKDCTDPSLQEEVDLDITYIGDNYKIIEIPGVLTIKTREIKVTPGSNQGFVYGNYTEDGDIPNIKFTETHEHDGDATGSGLVFGNGVYLLGGDSPINVNANNEFTINSVTYKIDGEFVIKVETKEKVGTVSVTESAGANSKTVTIGAKTYTMIQKSRCLVNISGLSIICLNDAQNEALASSGDFVGKKASVVIDANNSYKDYVDFAQPGLLSNLGYASSSGVPTLYNGAVEFNPSDTLLEYSSYNVYADVYSNPKNFNTRTESQSNSALDLEYNSTSGYRFSRDVGTYTIVQGSLGISDNVKKTKEIWIRITKSRLYSDANGTTQSDTGTYLKYGDKLINISGKDKYEYQCTLSGTKPNITASCSYVKDNTNGVFVKLETTDTPMTFYNYSIKTFVDGVTYSITPADIKVTPGEKQYKIYGEADVEIEFTVETTYTVANTHYSTNKNNIKQICNGATCYNSTNWNDYVSDNDVLLTAGWTVTLNNYAYKEYTSNAGTTEAAGNLDYGKNTAATKHAGTESKLDQATSGVDHYDKYTDYKASINTSRILIGNLYVNGNDQTVGEKAINGDKIIVAKNVLGNVNYTYNSAAADNKHYESKLFVIIPRPVNVEITNVTKTYGQATDKTSCESYDTECIVGQGILDDVYDTTNESKLANNFRIVTDRQTLIAPGEVTIDAKTVKDIKVIYYRSDDANKLARMNMPTAKTTAGDVYNDYATISAANANKYYTATGDAETKNASLDIEVNRENENIARNAECLVSESLVSGTAKGCEDVGEYNLKFVSKLGKTNSIAETLVTEGSITDGRGTNEAYGNAYWGYNPNYYVIVYKNFEASGWTNDNGSTSYASVSAATTLLTVSNNANPEESATLKIRKRPVEITVETISHYVYKQDTVGDGSGETISIGERNFLNIGTVDSPVYRQITRTNVYTKLASGKYSQLTLNDVSSASIPNDRYYLCEYVENNKNVDGNCYKIKDENRYKRFAQTVGEKYNIQQTMHVFPLPSATADPNDGVQYLSNSESTIHTTYKYLTWNEHNRQVRTADVLVGEVAYCNKASTLDPDLDSIRSSSCSDVSGQLKYYTANINTAGHSDWFDTKTSGHYVIVREASRLYIGSSTSMNETDGSTYEGNNYNTTFVNGILQIDDDKTAPIINVGTEFVQKEANDGKMIGTEEGTVLKFLDNLKTNGCIAVKDSASTYSECSGINFTFENDTDKTNAHLTYTETVNREYLATILDWFDISSLDPSVMRDEVPVQNNYFPRWYVAIQSDFDQRKVGDYTIFVYAQDLSGNVSLATTVTLRVVDTTDPEVGTLNLYDAKVKCQTGTDCRKEENWVVAESIYLPILNLDDDALPPSVKANKYLRTNNSYSLNKAYGTYYFIPEGTPASAVKHRGWTNARDGIYLNVTGGDDNSLAYLDTSKYSVKYTIDGTKITKGSGQNILYGSFIDLSHVVKYRKASIDSNGLEIFETGGTNVYIPDAEGTIIKYKGYYYDLSTGKYMNASGSDITAPTDAEYTVKLYTLSGNDYTPAVDGKAVRTQIAGKGEDETEYVGYYLLDGSFYQIPNDETYYKFDATNGYIRGTGEGFTYINIAQWDHYYSRDGGNSFIKYDRDATGEDDTSRYLALGQDGQRLIMIKAVDNGYNYATQDVTKTFYDKAYCDSMEQQPGRPNYFCDKWNKVNLGKGYNVAHSGSTITRTASSDGKYTEANGAKQMLYNVSQWHTYTDGQDAQDVKYAYLDTIGPNMWLNNQFIEVYEYGCTNCVKNYEETFGKVSDGYLFKLSSMTTYNSSGVATANGTHVKFNGVLIEIASSRRFNLNNDNSITQNNAGEYIYLGNTDTAKNIDTLITSKIIADASVKAYKVYDKTKAAGSRNVSKELPGSPTATATEDAVNLNNNTNKLNSGIGIGDDLFAGTTYGEGIAFGGGETIGDNFVRIQIYANVANTTNAVTGNDFITNVGNYKFQIQGTKAAGYIVHKCYRDFSGGAIGVNEFCEGSTKVGEASYESMDAAVEAILKANGGSIDFKGNDVTFTIDYSVYDLAGNESLYVRKGVLITSFARTAMLHNGGAAATALSIDLPQNADPALALSEFSVVTANGSNLRSDEKITQTIYYNGQVIAENEDYNVTALANLDTSVPGTYKVVYSISRREGSNYVQGNSVELVVNIKPDVASTSSANVDYKQIVTTAFIAASAILVFAYIYIANKKKKSN